MADHHCFLDFTKRSINITECVWNRCAISISVLRVSHQGLVVLSNSSRLGAFQHQSKNCNVRELLITFHHAAHWILYLIAHSTSSQKSNQINRRNAINNKCVGFRVSAICFRSCCSAAFSCCGSFRRYEQPPYGAKIARKKPLGFRHRSCQ